MARGIGRGVAIVLSGGQSEGDARQTRGVAQLDPHGQHAQGAELPAGGRHLKETGDVVDVRARPVGRVAHAAADDGHGGEAGLGHVLRRVQAHQSATAALDLARPQVLLAQAAHLRRFGAGRAGHVRTGSTDY